MFPRRQCKGSCGQSTDFFVAHLRAACAGSSFLKPASSVRSRQWQMLLRPSAGRGTGNRLHRSCSDRLGKPSRSGPKPASPLSPQGVAESLASTYEAMDRRVPRPTARATAPPGGTRRRSWKRNLPSGLPGAEGSKAPAGLTPICRRGISAWPTFEDRVARFAARGCTALAGVGIRHPRLNRSFASQAVACDATAVPTNGNRFRRDDQFIAGVFSGGVERRPRVSVAASLRRLQELLHAWRILRAW